MSQGLAARARRIVKRGLEWTLTTYPVARWARRRIEGKVLVLAYHGITPTGSSPVGERSLFVDQARFAEQLDAVRDAAEVVSLDRVGEPGGDQPRVAITFDDAYQGAVTAGADELVRRALPATIFVAPGRLNGHVFWWDALANAGPGLDEGLRRRALVEHSGADERVRAWARAEGIPASDALPAFARAATIDELRAVSTRGGITFGSHTWSHANLQRLTGAEVNDELVRSLAWLGEHFPRSVVRWLAYPYGLTSGDVELASRDAGYVGAFRIDGGWHEPAGVPPFARPRMNIPGGLSLDGFRARLLGALG